MPPGILAPPMPAFYRATLPQFISASDRELLGRLSLAHAEQFQSQLSDATTTWFADIKRLQHVLEAVVARRPAALHWSVLLEFTIPRKNGRIDAVLLAGDVVILLEQKSGEAGREAERQVEEYALLLHYFHKPSDKRRLVPLLVSPADGEAVDGRQLELALTDTAAFWIDPVRRVGWGSLAYFLAHYEVSSRAEDAVDLLAWDEGEYYPVPSIIEAARSLQAGVGTIREIAHSRAARHDIDELTAVIRASVMHARTAGEYVICFVTGVPGSGKTLVGLNLAFSSRADGETLSFMSGNAPLVAVLQALFVDYKRQVERVRASDAKIHASTLVEDVHLFAREYTRVHGGDLGLADAGLRAPANHVVIFDEAQRAWDYEQSHRKFGRETSEPEMFLQIMERHDDWAVIVALVGGGQEINTGEAGLAEWGRALAQTHRRPWRILASPEVTRGGDSVAGKRLLSDPCAAALKPEEDPRLHLTVSVRSLKAENYSKWVNCVIGGDAAGAAALQTGDFPVYLTRNLESLRAGLRNQLVGESRAGLVASSKAARLRADGLEPDSNFHANYPWDRWYLADTSDVRSSSRLEVYASEFEIQGLELDWIGLCWGGDFVWSTDKKAWLTRTFRNANKSGWTHIKNPAQQEFRKNSYRVLLTRARQGLLLYVPTGDVDDLTRSPAEFDSTAEYLCACGVRPLMGDERMAGFPVQAGDVKTPTLFHD